MVRQQLYNHQSIKPQYKIKRAIITQIINIVLGLISQKVSDAAQS